MSDLCPVCGVLEDEAETTCPLADEDEKSDAWEEANCIVLCTFDGRLGADSGRP
jgi:hypothetical protein